MRNQIWTLAATWFLIVAPTPTFAEDHPPPAIAPFDAEQAKEFQQQWARHLDKEVVFTNSIGMKMVLVPPGEFTMGNDEAGYKLAIKGMLKGSYYERQAAHRGFNNDEEIAHRVRLNKPFYMGAHEVTVGQFRQFVDESGYRTDAERGLVYGHPYKGEKPIRTWRKTFYEPPDDHPVLQVNWNDAVAFCTWLAEKEASEGHQYCLPTEAEWEYACRAGSKAEYCFGDDPALLGEYAWVTPTDAPHPRERTWPDMAVGGRKPNAWGIYDMHGNAWEWCQDWWDKDYYGKSPLTDPLRAIKGHFKVLRGGAVKSYGRFARSAFRLFINPDVPDDDRTLLTSARLVINLPASKDDNRPQTTGTIEGVVTYSSDVPKSKVPDNAGHKRNLLSVHRKSRGLQYVLVHLEPDEKNQFDSYKPEAQEKKAASDPIVIDQIEHAFVPHLIAIRDATMVKFTNSDAANHNVRTASFESKNQFNVFTGAGGKYTHQFVAGKKLRPILLSCDIHPWMRAWMYVFKHPFFAVTDENGEYRIGSIPPDVYRLTIRQPDVGYLNSLTVDVKAGVVTKLETKISQEHLKRK